MRVRERANAAIKRAPKEGGEPTTIASDQNQAIALAVDAEFVYWANSYSVGTIQRCPLAGCTAPPEVLVTKQNSPHELAVDGKWLNWIRLVDDIDVNGTRAAVMRCALADCASSTETLAVQLFSLEGMSMAADNSTSRVDCKRLRS